jgi:hypothetical protein
MFQNTDFEAGSENGLLRDSTPHWKGYPVLYLFFTFIWGEVHSFPQIF